MRLLTSPDRKLSMQQVSVAAQNIVAAQFALCGFDVFEQAGHGQFFNDIGVAKSGGMMKVMVRGSLDGFWDLADVYLEKNPSHATWTDYHRAVDLWLESHSSSIVCCLVQFELADLNRMPRMYLALAAEVAERLHQSTDQLGDPALYEQYELTDACGTHRIETLPVRWRFSHERILELMERQGAAALRPFTFPFSEAARCRSCAAVQPESCLDCLPMMN